MCRNLTPKSFMWAFFLCMGLSFALVSTSQALEGKAGEVIQTMEELQDLYSKGMISDGFFKDYSELIQNNIPLKIVETTDRSIMHSKNYLETSEKNRGKAKIGPDDELLNYKGGRPFMDVNPDDPQAGIKIAWNFQYRYLMGDSYVTWWNYYLVDAKGYTKKIWGYANLCSYNFRTDIDPKPQFDPASPEVWNKYLLTFLGPFESKGLSQLRVKYIEGSRKNDVWVYVPGLRRATRVGAAAGCDAMGGFVSVADDDFGFSGNILDFNYVFVAEKELLVPTLTPPPPEFWEIIEGLHNPRLILEKHKIWIVDQVAKDPDYCYAKRRFFLFPENFHISTVEMYNQADELWKNYYECYGILPNPPQVGGFTPVMTTGSCTDYKIGEAGVFQCSKIEINPPNKPSDFTMDAMRRRGR